MRSPRTWVDAVTRAEVSDLVSNEISPTWAPVPRLSRCRAPDGAPGLVVARSVGRQLGGFVGPVALEENLRQPVHGRNAVGVLDRDRARRVRLGARVARVGICPGRLEPPFAAGQHRRARVRLL